MNISNYLEEKILNHVMRNEVYASPSTVYVGIVKETATNEDLETGILTGEITEYDGNRKEVTFSAPSQVMGKATITNENILDFENMPALDSNNKVKYAIVCDAATNGNILYWCPANAEKVTNAGDTYRIPVGDLTLDLD